MTVSSPLSLLARQWPLVAVILGSALGALYCAAYWALARSLVAAHADASGHWRTLAMLYLAGLVACLALFLVSCARLRRHRIREGAGIRGPSI